MLKFIFIFIVHLCSVIAQSNFQIQNRRSAKDLPVQQDLDKFLKPIETLTNYLANNITDIEINFALGIFFTNVHFRRVLLDKGQNIPDHFLSRIKVIIDTNEQSLLYFHRAAKTDIEFMERDHVIISDLFKNTTYWALRAKKMRYQAEPTYSYSSLEVTYSKWTIYKDNVDKVFEWIPSPKNSDTSIHIVLMRYYNVMIALVCFGSSDVCLVTLAVNPTFKGNSTSWCPVSRTCYNMLTEGTNFGYALCHRLSLLIMSQLGRGCFILSGLEDEKLKQEFCTMAYAEAEYIAMNDFGIADLLLEIMCFCALDGRVQFLRRKWLHKMFDFEDKNGCFGIRKGLVRTIGRRTQLAECNSHTTLLASATYAAAVRFIFEEYY